MLTRVMGTHNIRVMQRRGNLHLAPESLPELLVRSEGWGEHLQGVDPVQRHVSRAIPTPHPPAPDRFVDAVPRDDGATLNGTARHLHLRTSPSSRYSSRSD